MQRNHRRFILDAQPICTTTAESPTVAAVPQLDANLEVEVKLLVPAGGPAGGLELFRTAPVIARHACNAGLVRRLEATYYDTADRLLYRHGLSLRVRRDGRRFTQTLKRAAVHGQPFVRGEWETPAAGMAPDLTLLPVAEIGTPLDGLGNDALAAVFVTKIRRRRQRLELPGAVVEVSFDDGSIAAADRRERVTEIELELKAGDAGVIYDLGLQLLEIAPLCISTRSKADRGYALAFDTVPKATKAMPPGISAEHTADDVLALLLASCQHHLLANQTLAESGRDPEGVHQMRVALRRLRTACTLLSREVGSPTLLAFASEAKWLAQVLGEAREWDVLVTDTLRGPMRSAAACINFDAFRQAAEPPRMAAYATLRETLADPRYSRFHLSLRKLIESRGWRNEMPSNALAALLDPAPAVADRLLADLHRKAIKRGAHFRRLQPADRHRLRIALKKLRYVVDFFRQIYPENTRSKSYVASLAKLQDALGHANDAAMTQPFLTALGNDHVAPDVQHAIGALCGWQARDGIEIDKTLRKHWRRFKTLPMFWAD